MFPRICTPISLPKFKGWVQFSYYQESGVNSHPFSLDSLLLTLATASVKKKRDFPASRWEKYQESRGREAKVFERCNTGDYSDPAASSPVCTCSKLDL